MPNKNICKQLPVSTSELSYNAGDTVPLNKCSAIYVGQKFLKYVRYMQAEHLNMLEGGIIAKLLEEKWKTFAQVLLRVYKYCVYNNTCTINQ